MNYVAIYNRHIMKGTSETLALAGVLEHFAFLENQPKHMVITTPNKDNVYCTAIDDNLNECDGGTCFILNAKSK